MDAIVERLRTDTAATEQGNDSSLMLSNRPFICLASKDGYEDSVLPTGDLAGAPEDALDTACGLYLGDPTAWA